MFDVEKIREEFPILHREVYGKPLVYLDSGATAQKPRTVIETVDRLHRELNANIHRGVHFLSEEATVLYEAARERIASFVGAAAKEEIVFTAGATASLNTVAYAWGDAFVGAGDNILVSEMEHHSNIVPWQMLAERKGAEIRVLPFDEAGALRTDLLPSLVDERTRVVAVTQASNTLGTRPDLRIGGRSGACRGGRCRCRRLSGRGSRRGRCPGDGLRLLRLLGPQTLRADGNRRAVRQARTAGTDAAVHGRRRHGRHGDVREDHLCPRAAEIRGRNGQFRGRHRTGRSGEVHAAVRPCGDRSPRGDAAAPRHGAAGGIGGLRIYGTAPGKCAILSFNVEGCIPTIWDDSRQAGHCGPHGPALRRAGDGPLRDDGHVPGLVRAVQYACGGRCAGRRGRTGREYLCATEN